MKKTLTTITAAAVLFSVGTTTAFASTTTQSVIMKHNAYLISAPKTGSAKRAFETDGTLLTVLSGSNKYWWHVKDEHGKTGYITRNTYYTTASSKRPIAIKLPPGVNYDYSIKPLAAPSASRTAKLNALLKVAKSKLGTPYILGHNEDRGQYGFDCSNFVEYVYHHALGYTFTTSSVGQYRSVGTQVTKSQMKPGDLLCFHDGGHSGIYIGNGEMIQCGGGIAKVGYLSLKPGWYWGKHISAVKRMF